jgi:hypothetical protein
VVVTDKNILKQPNKINKYIRTNIKQLEACMTANVTSSASYKNSFSFAVIGHGGTVNGMGWSDEWCFNLL